MCGESDDEMMNGGEVDQRQSQQGNLIDEKKGIKGDAGTEKVGKRKIRVAVAGCVHGEIDKVYRTMEELEKDGKGKFDLLLCCGDFQATRNYGDLHHIKVSDKYRNLESFHQYYSQAKEAPVLTIFIGGNHEASGFMSELPNGGWVAPNIYYMGHSNVVKFAGLRIGGLSGIMERKDYDKGRFECPPFKGDSIVSVYHVRSLDVFRCKQLSALDIFLSHDWPTGIWDYGDKEWLVKQKRGIDKKTGLPNTKFADDINAAKMGNPYARELLMKLRPHYWFSAHMHIGFAALVEHQKREGEEEERVTRFLALDKPLPRRHFLQSLDLWVDSDADLSLSYDEEWLAILKSTDSLISTRNEKVYLPTKLNKTERFDFRPTEQELSKIRSLREDLLIPINFQLTAPPLLKDDAEAKKAPPSYYYRNPQSAEFCSWLGITDVNEILAASSTTVATPYYQMVMSSEGMKDVDQDREEFGEADFIIDSDPTPNDAMGDSVGGDNVLKTTMSKRSIDGWEEPMSSELKKRRVNFDGEE